jgi:uncharacterized protein (DUF427 family)
MFRSRPQRIPPGPGQESVWDYPRPPRLEIRTDKHVRVIFNGVQIAESRRPIRILETSHPPTYYLPPEDVRMEYFKPITRSTFCEFKGSAAYYTLVVGEKSAAAVAWYYPNPTPAYAALKNYIALYASRMEVCYVNGEQVTAQAGDFYGGWITQEIVGPFKGDPGTEFY